MKKSKWQGYIMEIASNPLPTCKFDHILLPCEFTANENIKN